MNLIYTILLLIIITYIKDLKKIEKIHIHIFEKSKKIQANSSRLIKYYQ